MENNDQKGESYRPPPEEGAEGRSAKAGEAQLKYVEEVKRIVLSVDEINERLTNDETLLQIAKDAGLSDEEIQTLLTDAHKAAWEAAGVDTTGTFYQNMVERMKNMWANREDFQGKGCRGGPGGRMGRWINPES